MYRLILILAVFMIAGCSGPKINGVTGPMPDAPREFRAVWIASVVNIDWPSRDDMTVAEQQDELRAMMDRTVALNMNAVLLQVRPAADALYWSPFEPWSEYLTGEMGKAPVPFYDPLAFAVEEAHKRGLEIHAWINPFRARHKVNNVPEKPASNDHISITHPDWVVAYDDYVWIDPGNKAATTHTLRVLQDIVKRYDIDGLHMDDYFYPYPIKDENDEQIDFPDDVSWEKALAGGETLSRADWRRANVDHFVEDLYHLIKATKKYVKFGISPFGVWKPGVPEGIKGYDAYHKLYADARRWTLEGWLDYFTPQLYWGIEQEGVEYPILMNWWTEQNPKNRHIWPGNYTSRIGGYAGPNAVWDPEELINQIKLTQAHPNATGNVHFSMKALMNNPAGLESLLINEVYPTPAIIPASPWLGSEAPEAPSIRLENLAGSGVVHLRPAGGKAVWMWEIRARFGNTWVVKVIPGWNTSYTFEHPAGAIMPDEVAVSAVNRIGVTGEVVKATIPE